MNEEILETPSPEETLGISSKKSVLHKKKHPLVYVKKFFILTIGALLYSAGLEIFLVPNEIIDGGIVGISIMASHLSGLPFSILMLY